MTNPENTETKRSFPTPGEVAAKLRNEANVRRVGDRVVTETTGYGVVNLGTNLDDRSRANLAEWNALYDKSKQVFGSGMEKAAKETYDHIKMLEASGYKIGEIIPTKFAEDERGGTVVIQPGAPTDEEQSKRTSYYTATTVNAETGNLESAVSYPVPYEHGNGVFVARNVVREDGTNSLDGIVDFIGAEGITKQMYVELTDAVRVNHVGGPDEVDARIADNLGMPITEFSDDAKREAAMKRAKRARD